jgi:hypothetical protein
MQATSCHRIRGHGGVLEVLRVLRVLGVLGVLEVLGVLRVLGVLGVLGVGCIRLYAGPRRRKLALRSTYGASRKPSACSDNRESPVVL